MVYVIRGEAEVQRGLGLPRLTTTERNSYTPPFNGYKVYDTTQNREYTRVGGAWVAGDPAAVKLTGNQTITGVKTFNTAPVFRANPRRQFTTGQTAEYELFNSTTGSVAGSFGTISGGVGIRNGTGAQALSITTTFANFGGVNLGVQVTNPRFVLNNGGDNTDAEIIFNNGGPTTGTLTFTHSNNVLTASGTMKIRSAATVIGDDGTTLTTKDYVDALALDPADFVQVTGAQTVAGAKTFSDNLTVNASITASGIAAVGTSPSVTSSAATGNAANFTMNVNSVRRGLILGNDSSTSMRAYESDGTTINSEIVLGNALPDVFLRVGNLSHTQFRRAASGSLDIHKITLFSPGSDPATDVSELEMRNAGNAMRIATASNMTGSYTVVMPPGPPTTVGQVLEVDSISGQFINMKWA